MAPPRLLIVGALDDQLCPQERIMTSRMVHVEVGTDENVDVVGMQVQIGEALDYGPCVLGWWCARLLITRGQSAIDQDIRSIAGLYQIAAQDEGQLPAMG